MSQLETIKEYVRATNYLSASQIYLQDNFLLTRPLKREDIKPKLLGHWGSSPGVNFIYAHLNALINKYKQETLFVLGPGHAFAALQSNLFVEKSLQEFYPDAKHDLKGIEYIVKNFSWPYGFPSHSNPGAPGVILEGGELGYSLSTAYGAAMDNPDLLVACVIGDGEAETGALATSWHLNKFMNPGRDGVVLPILHLNGYKISGPTIFGRMSDIELNSLFRGYGYNPYIVDAEEDDDDQLYLRMQKTLDRCYREIIETKKSLAKRFKPSPKMPMIVLRTKKGWTGIPDLKGVKLEGNYASHQVIAPNARDDSEELKALEAWLRSYKFNELFDEKHGFNSTIKSLVPKGGLRMGMNKHALGGDPVYKPLDLPDVNGFCKEGTDETAGTCSSMLMTGGYLEEVFRRNPNNFRLMSPDETYSNKLQEVFEVTDRAFAWPLKPWDKDLSPDGRVMEMLSEHSLQGLIQGYVLTGRHAIFASYEAFVQIVGSMADQYAKFLAVSHEVPWRGEFPSLNYILTSSGWRQEHNGFSHQNPGFIDDMLNRQGCYVNVYFPPDGNSTLVTLKHCLQSRREINIIVAGKTDEIRWLSIEESEKEFKRGLMVWDFASDANPDVVLAAVGDYLTKETLAAITVIKEYAPEIKVRFVNIMSLSSIGLGDASCRVPFYDFDDYFTHDKPVIFNFHGYPQTLKQVLFDYGNVKQRFSVHGYGEQGSTTTAFDMHVRNKTSRYHLAMEVFGKMAVSKVITEKKSKELIKILEIKLQDHNEYIRRVGSDPDEINNWVWKKHI